MGPDYYNHTTHLSIHEAGSIKDGSWLNHTDYCRKALGWLLMWTMAYNEVIVVQ